MLSIRFKNICLNYLKKKNDTMNKEKTTLFLALVPIKFYLIRFY